MLLYIYIYIKSKVQSSMLVTIKISDAYEKSLKREKFRDLNYNDRIMKILLLFTIFSNGIILCILKHSSQGIITRLFFSSVS